MAEDNKTNQLVAKLILQRLGCTPTVVESGQDAIEALSKQPFDVVLIDCQMPGMDGYETTRAIRSGLSQVQNPDVFIIAMTASALNQDRERCFPAGMNDFLSKPVSVRVLASALQHAAAAGRHNNA